MPVFCFCMKKVKEINVTKTFPNRMWVIAGIAALIAGFTLNLNAALWGNDAIFNTVVSLVFINV